MKITLHDTIFARMHEISDGSFSEKWNQIAIFKNANKLHESSWSLVIIDRISWFLTNIFLFTYIFLDYEVSDFFMLQYQKIICSAMC